MKRSMWQPSEPMRCSVRTHSAFTAAVRVQEIHTKHEHRSRSTTYQEHGDILRRSTAMFHPATRIPRACSAASLHMHR